ncbi:hypothetical protein POM88_052060 [Heracleum sosnowskyi]|uniref:Uncharacterized protein n=1 Tax=Heracleum sosnowskyi TaxID=360622 RepID=A0AAD8GT55_9APIA|nr:hypothetical protein POM88_052060 [Heracleum sosnowskyi]
MAQQIQICDVKPNLVTLPHCKNTINVQHLKHGTEFVSPRALQLEGNWKKQRGGGHVIGMWSLGIALGLGLGTWSLGVALGLGLLELFGLGLLGARRRSCDRHVFVWNRARAGPRHMVIGSCAWAGPVRGVRVGPVRGARFGAGSGLGHMGFLAGLDRLGQSGPAYQVLSAT